MRRRLRRVMRRRKVKTIGRKWQVYRGTRTRTAGGLRKEDLMRNKAGKIVSRKQHLHSKKNKSIGNWTVAVKKARNAMNVKGFVPVGGKTAEGQALLQKAHSFYRR